MIKANELSRGKVVVVDGKMYTVKDLTHVSKGNWRSYMQVKLKDFKTGQIIDQRFNMDDKLETAFVQTKEYEYLYRDGDDFVLADTDTYDQIPVSAELIGDSVKFLKENTRVTCAIVDEKIISVELPFTVELKVVDTPPVVKGATVTNQPKDAELETGARVRVPAFIDVGEVVRVDTRTGEYIERAK
jgi:elongation factor P